MIKTMSFTEFEGPPCLQINNYLFYKTFKYNCDGKWRILSLGDFFFLKILDDIPVCIGEIELLWEDKTSDHLLCSIRLYFRPEFTPIGRQHDTGEVSLFFSIEIIFSKCQYLLVVNCLN